ncbi:MAG: DUF1080 domain-containing protein [Gemmataceae bacterium]
MMRRWLAVSAVVALPVLWLMADSRAADPAAPNTLTAEETKAGWKLLFDGKSFDGWHNFKRDGVRPGWQIKDGTLVCADPKNAGDIVTKDHFGWFDLSLEYNITEGGNSGIMFHVTDEERTPWATGPEIQLQDNVKAKDPQLSGWLYQLYKPADDPKTGKPFDATKAVGEWNLVRVVIAAPPAKSFVSMNNEKYYEFEFGSDDFKARIAKSKFKSMPKFAKAGSGSIALQGDHGSVAFRNIKIRPLEGAK